MKSILSSAWTKPAVCWSLKLSSHYRCNLDGNDVTTMNTVAVACPTCLCFSSLWPPGDMSKFGNAYVVQHLLKNKARIKATERRGQTALMWAAAEGHANVIDLLIKAGADVKASTARGFSAMMFAAREGHIDAVKDSCRQEST
ncbi:MAG: ankyrin repeat domain-containing protein [Planctomycetales bacterium]|jgi:ankyrin repeat protein